MANCGECGKLFHLSKRFTVETRNDSNGFWRPGMEVCEDCYEFLKKK